MNRLKLLPRAIGISALLAMTSLSVTAHAGLADEARKAIAAAKAKIEAGDKIGASGEAATIQVQARDALHRAEAEFGKGEKNEAIAEAKHAGDLADQAIVLTDKRKQMAEQAGRHEAEAAAGAAQQSAAVSAARANSAEATAADAQARAAAAQQSAASANAQADAMRDAPPPPAPATSTTVTTVDKDEAAAPVVHHVRHRVHHTRVRGGTHAVHQTTTTVTTAPQN